MKSILILFSVLAISLAGCKPGDANDKTGDNAMSADTSMTDSTAVNPITLTPFSDSKSFPDASLKAMAYMGGTFSTVIGGASYKLGEQTPDANEKQCANSKEGQHLHLIIDNEPYIAKYESAFAHEIADGDHHLLCFLSRSYHESIKTDAAHRAVKVNIKNKSIVNAEDITEPMMFYSRPKGLYTGDDTKKVMLDFYLINTDLSSHKVEADINGQKFTIDQWKPYYMEGLPEGENTITLTLVDSTGKQVNTPFNPVTRTFTLEKTPATN
jgi:hypothetical protein